MTEIRLPGETDCCPECGSDDVAIGASVLFCFKCGWTKVGENKCDECEQKATGYVGVNGTVHHWCETHWPAREKLNRLIGEALQLKATIWFDKQAATRGVRTIGG